MHVGGAGVFRRSQTRLMDRWILAVSTFSPSAQSARKQRDRAIEADAWRAAGLVSRLPPCSHFSPACGNLPTIISLFTMWLAAGEFIRQEQSQTKHPRAAADIVSAPSCIHIRALDFPLQRLVANFRSQEREALTR